MEYTGAVGTAPSLNSRQMNGQFDATPPSSARGRAWVRELAQRAAAEMVEFELGAGAVIFTDDQEPLEEMTPRMLLESKKQ